MKLTLLILCTFFLSCSTDVSIMKRNQDSLQDTTSQDTIDTDIDQSDTSDETFDYDDSLVVGFLEYGFIQASCPYCFGMPTEISFWLYGRFHEPTGSNHAAWVPRSDEFCRQYYEAPVTAVNLDLGQSVDVVAGPHTHTMTKTYDQSGVVYKSPTYNTDSNYARDVDVYTTIDGQPLADESFKSLHGFDFVEPYTMLYTDASYAYAAPINKTSNTFTWGPSGDADSFFTIHVSVYSYDGASYYGTVICRGEDTGNMTIPGSYFTTYPSGSLVSIHLIRHRMKDLRSDLLQGRVKTHAWWEVIGTGYIQ